MIESLSGIRGVYGSDLTVDVVRDYAHAYIQALCGEGNRPVTHLVVGRDTRASGDEIAEVFFKVWKNHYGIDVIDVGVLPTPLVENAVRAFEAHGGVIITASHNEPEYNGMKFLRPTGGTLYAHEAENLIFSAHQKERGEEGEDPGEYTEEHHASISSYIKLVEQILGPVAMDKNLKVYLDANGGSAAMCAEQIFTYFGIAFEKIGFEPGKFWRKVEPRVENLVGVKSFFGNDMSQNSFAACFDCDADRVEFVLPDGQVLAGNVVLGLLFESLLSEKTSEKNKKVVVNDATSGLVRDIAKSYGYEVEEVEVGESNVVYAMEIDHLLYGGEGSSGGGIVFPNRCRDGILSTLIVCKLMSQTGKSLSQLLHDMPHYTYIAEKLSGVSFGGLREKFRTYATQHSLKITTTGDDTGGMKIWFDEYTWVWIRGSKTEPDVVRMHFDGREEGKVLEVQRIMHAIAL